MAVTVPTYLHVAYVDEPDNLLIDMPMGVRTLEWGDRFEVKVLLNRDGTLVLKNMMLKPQH